MTHKWLFPLIAGMIWLVFGVFLCVNADMPGNLLGGVVCALSGVAAWMIGVWVVIRSICLKEKLDKNPHHDIHWPS